jgi:hypothetical protein
MSAADRDADRLLAALLAPTCRCDPHVTPTLVGRALHLTFSHDQGCPAIGGEVWS